MRIYFAGIGGVGLGPLAEIALDAGYSVLGSDPVSGLMTSELEKKGVDISQMQDGSFLRSTHTASPIDRVVYTAAMSSDHPELVAASELGIPAVKRDAFLAEIIAAKHLKLIAVAGTHGKTTTTAMMVWAFQQLGIPVSYSVGTTLAFGPSGKYAPGSEYFIYECDEFDRNFLHFSPHLSLVTSIDYDHPDSYPTQADYTGAFTQFMAQSGQVIMWARDTTINVTVPGDAWLLNDGEVIDIPLAGAHNRANATLVAKGFEYLEISDEASAAAALGTFPGSDRRFEKLADNLYSDYGHHPVEVAATLQLARELSDHIVLVYQPHQNTRQHQVRSGYTSCMELAEQIYWLPTYLAREDASLATLTPQELTENLRNRDSVVYADLNDELWQHITDARRAGKLVLCMGAGTIDGWLRAHTATPAKPAL